MPKQKKVNPAVLFFPEGTQHALEYVKHYPLTIAYAPGGFGKTTAFRHFFERSVSKTTRVLWHTFLSEQATASWNAICRLIGQIDETCSGGLIAAGVPSPASLSNISEILENLECNEETYLMLDSFEASGLPQPEAFLGSLSRHGGVGLHIVAVTRKLAAGSLLSSHRIYLLNAEDFAFSAEDTQAYFQSAGLAVTKGQALSVHQSTDGWVLALHMQIMAYIKYGAFSSAGAGQLMHQVLWEDLSPAERDFFLSVCIFPRFTLAQAAELSSMDLAQVERLLFSQSAFVHFDHETYNFYLHTVFSAFLKEQFQALPAQLQKQLYYRGGNVAYRAGDRLNTLRFYYYSNAWEELFSMPLTSYELADIMDETTKPMILDVIDHVPYEIKAKYPASIIPFAFTLFFLHENQRLLAAQEEFTQIILQSDLPQRRKDKLLGEMDLLLSFLEYNRIDAMSVKHRSALQRIGGAASLINVKSTWTFGSPSVLYLFWRESGKLQQELAQMDECMPIYYQLTQGHGTGAEHIMRAEADFLQGDMEQAEVRCYRALFTADTRQQNSIYLCGLFLMTRIAVMRGDESLLENTMHTIMERSRQNTEDLCRYTQDLSLGYLAVLMDKPAAIAPWLAEGDISEQRLVVMVQPFAYLIYGRCLLSAKQYHKLLGVCQHMMALSSIFPNLLPQVYCHIYMAQALFALGKHTQALAALTEALHLALPDRVYMPFVENYQGLSPLLTGVMHISDQEGLKTIEALTAQYASSLSRLHAQKPVLSSREREVYELARQGIDNREIAARLGIQISTVKNLFSRIYEKAGVSSKVQLLLLDL